MHPANQRGATACLHGLVPTGPVTAALAPQAFIAKHLRNVGFAQVYGANHFPHFEQPAQTNAAIEAFIARL